MEIKVKVSYQIEGAEELIICETLEQAEKKLKSLRSSELECYLYRIEKRGKSITEQFLVG